jgi:hypothetical protein
MQMQDHDIQSINQLMVTLQARLTIPQSNPIQSNQFVSSQNKSMSLYIHVPSAHCIDIRISPFASASRNAGSHFFGHLQSPSTFTPSITSYSAGKKTCVPVTSILDQVHYQTTAQHLWIFFSFSLGLLIGPRKFSIIIHRDARLGYPYQTAYTYQGSRQQVDYLS